MSNNFDRRRFLKILGIGAAVSAVPQKVFSFPAVQSNKKELILYAGTYTTGKSEGIYLFKMNSDSGKLTIEKTFGGIVNPSFLALDHGSDFLYAVSEIDNYEGKKAVPFIHIK